MQTGLPVSMRLALIGDAQSPHLLKWAQALNQAPGVELWVASSRGFLAGFDALLPAERRLGLGHEPRHEGGNVGLLRALPALGAWLERVDADWLHAHYLTSHGTLAWLSKRLWRLRGQLVGSAWGSDILVTPQRSWVYRALTQRVLRACRLCTSDSAHMTERMHELGAREVMTFPFGLEALPPAPPPKDPWLFFANRGLEPLYRPDAVLAFFAQQAQLHPGARLVVANDGSMGAGLPQRARSLGLTVGRVDEGQQVEFTGRLPADAQAAWYARAQWYLSLPQSDSVSVSLLEAMAHGCIPVVSNLPANREWVRDADNGLVLAWEAGAPARLEALRSRAEAIGRDNRDRIARDGLFPPAVARFLARLRELPAPADTKGSS